MKSSVPSLLFNDPNTVIGKPHSPEGTGGGEQISRNGERTWVGARLIFSNSPLFIMESTISCIQVVPGETSQEKTKNIRRKKLIMVNLKANSIQNFFSFVLNTAGKA